MLCSLSYLLIFYIYIERKTNLWGGVMRTQFNLYLDEKVINFLRSRGRGKASQYVETAIYFYERYKTNINECTRIIKNVSIVTCTKCNARFSVRLTRCPNCGNTKAYVNLQSELTEEEKTLLSALRKR